MDDCSKSDRFPHSRSKPKPSHTSKLFSSKVNPQGLKSLGVNS